MNILKINSSPMGDSSTTRQLTADFVAQLVQKNSSVDVVERDLAAQQVPLLSAEIISAFYTAPQSLAADQQTLIALSNEMVDELEKAQVIVIGAPMHNFSINGQLKTYIDQIARVGRTFQYTENGPKGLLTGKQVFVLVASGGDYTSGPYSVMDHLTGYLKTVLGFVGLSQVTFVQCPNMAGSEEAKASSIASATAQIAELTAKLSE